MKVPVVGGAGDIGAHGVKMLIDRGHEAIVFDNLCTGYRDDRSIRTRLRNS